MLTSLLATLGTSTIIDRIAVVAGDRVVKDSDISRDIRLVSFLNNEKPDFSAASRRTSASRLIDQVLIRREVEAGEYPAPAAGDVNQLLDSIKKRFQNNARYEEALRSYGIGEGELKAQLRWQLTVLRFIDLRFRPAVLVTDDEIRKYYQEHRTELHGRNPDKPDDLDHLRPEIERALTGQGIDDQFFAWLDARRKGAKLDYHEDTLR